MSARNFFTDLEREEIEGAITKAEEITSGEIRIHLENTCEEDVLDHAAWIFEQLEMHATDKRNGILIYLAVEDKKFSILGDTGINEVLGEDYWEGVKNKLSQAFKEGQFKTGLISSIREIGESLKKHFPLSENDENELPNTISFGEDENEKA